MKNHLLFQKPITLLIFCFFILATFIQPADAGKGSRAFSLTLLVSGLGLQIGSTFVNASAEERYEDYLIATTQTDIQDRKSEVVTLKNTSTSMSRTGYGFIGLAVIISIFDQIKSSANDNTNITQLENRTNYSTNMSVISNVSGLSDGNVFFSSSERVGLYPFYDFQKQQTTLQFIHRF